MTCEDCRNTDKATKNLVLAIEDALDSEEFFIVISGDKGAVVVKNIPSEDIILEFNEVLWNCERAGAQN